jgi:2'-5' RNA ligase
MDENANSGGPGSPSGPPAPPERRKRKGEKKQPRHRLFVAAYPPPALARAALERIGSLGLPEHRATPGEQVHLTLQFIGDTDPRELDAVRESVARSASGLAAFELTPARLITLPKRGPSRLVALETDAPPGVLELHRRLAHRLASETRKDAADRFLPHLTLCRFRRPARGVRVDEGVELDPFVVPEIRLMRSVLRPEGAEHRVVEAFGLG